MKYLSENDISRIINNLDPNNSGRISEFDLENLDNLSLWSYILCIFNLYFIISCLWMGEGTDWMYPNTHCYYMMAYLFYNSLLSNINLVRIQLKESSIDQFWKRNVLTTINLYNYYRLKFLRISELLKSIWSFFNPRI